MDILCGDYENIILTKGSYRLKQIIYQSDKRVEYEVFKQSGNNQSTPVKCKKLYNALRTFADRIEDEEIENPEDNAKKLIEELVESTQKNIGLLQELKKEISDTEDGGESSC